MCLFIETMARILLLLLLLTSGNWIKGDPTVGSSVSGTTSTEFAQSGNGTTTTTVRDGTATVIDEATNNQTTTTKSENATVKFDSTVLPLTEHIRSTETVEELIPTTSEQRLNNTVEVPAITFGAMPVTTSEQRLNNTVEVTAITSGAMPVTTQQALQETVSDAQETDTIVSTIADGRNETRDQNYTNTVHPTAYADDTTSTNASSITVNTAGITVATNTSVRGDGDIFSTINATTTTVSIRGSTSIISPGSDAVTIEEQLSTVETSSKPEFPTDNYYTTPDQSTPDTSISKLNMTLDLVTDSPFVSNGSTSELTSVSSALDNLTWTVNTSSTPIDVVRENFTTAVPASSPVTNNVSTTGTSDGNLTMANTTSWQALNVTSTQLPQVNNTPPATTESSSNITYSLGLGNETLTTEPSKVNFSETTSVPEPDINNTSTLSPRYQTTDGYNVTSHYTFSSAGLKFNGTLADVTTYQPASFSDENKTDIGFTNTTHSQLTTVTEVPFADNFTLNTSTIHPVDVTSSGDLWSSPSTAGRNSSLSNWSSERPSSYATQSMLDTTTAMPTVDSTYELIFAGNCAIIISDHSVKNRFKVNLIYNLAVGLNIVKERINIQVIRCGSLNVTVAISDTKDTDIDQRLVEMVEEDTLRVAVEMEDNSTIIFSAVDMILVSVPLTPSSAGPTGHRTVSPDDGDDDGLGRIELLIIIVCACLAAIIIIVCIGFCIRRCTARRKTQKSFNLGDTPSLNVTLEDFTLMKMERPYPVYNEQGPVLHPDYSERDTLPSRRATGMATVICPDYERAYVPLALPSERPSNMPSLPNISPSSSPGPGARSAGVSGTDNTGTDNVESVYSRTGYDNPSFSSDDILDSAHASDAELPDLDEGGDEDAGFHHHGHLPSRNSHSLHEEVRETRQSSPLLVAHTSDNSSASSPLAPDDHGEAATLF